MMRDSVAHFRRKVTFYVIGQFLPDVLAVDFYDLGRYLHGSSDHPMHQLQKGDR